RSYGDWSSDVCSSDLDGERTALHSPFPVFRSSFFISSAGHLSHRERAEHGHLQALLLQALQSTSHLGVLVVALEIDEEYVFRLRSEERRVGKECETGR